MSTLNITAREMQPGDMLLAIPAETGRDHAKVVFQNLDRSFGIEDINRLDFIGYYGSRPWQILFAEEPVTVLRPETPRERARVYTWLGKQFSRFVGTGREWEEQGEAVAKLMHLMEHGCEAQNLDVYILRVIARYDRRSAEYAARYVSYMG